MEKSLSNELFVVGVSLDCLRAGVPTDSFLDNRLSALSGQVLSDSKKVEEIEDCASKLAFLRSEFSNYLTSVVENGCDAEEQLDFYTSVFGARFVSILKDG